jgi:DNA-binding NtrC family response regulator
MSLHTLKGNAAMFDKQKPLVMVIDQDTKTSAFLFPLLDAEGYRTASCSATAKPLSAVQRQHPDLVIVGKEMENCDGMILIGRIKEMSPDTRTILLVEPGDWPSLLDATDAGADDLQRKHFGSVKLLLSVLRLLDPVQDQAAARCLEMRAH